MFFFTQVTPFCEGKLRGFETLNTLSSTMMIFWSFYKLNYYSRKVVWGDFFDIFSILSINCWCSALFHSTLSMGFKFFDEISMIVPLWLGILMLLKLNTTSRKNYICLSYVVHILNLSILVFNSFPHFQWLFPFLFTVELLLIVWYYYKLRTDGYNDVTFIGIQGILICSFAGIVWWITETFCNSSMLYGHAIWHICMPIGIDCICQFILLVKNKKYRNSQLHKFIIV